MPPSCSGASERTAHSPFGNRPDSLVSNADRRIDIDNIRRVNYF